METTPIETSAQANLEVVPPVTSGSDDWASRMESQIDAINKETDATRYGRTEEKEAKKAAKSAEKSIEKPVGETDKEKPEKSEKTKDVEKSEKPKDAKEETPKGLTEKAAVKWGELRAEAAKAKEYVKTIETLKSELETLKSTPVNSAELEQLRQINAQYEQELALSRVESTRAFQENVHAPMVNVVEYLESLASKYELSSRDMLGAFAESDPAKQSDLIADLAASMNERDRLRFYSSADDYAEIISRRDYYQANSREWKAQLEAQHQAELAQHTAQSEQQVSAQRAEYEQAVEKVFDSLKESVPVLEDDEVAADVQRLAKGDYSGADPELKAYMAHSGALLPHLLKALKAAQSELEDANKKIVGYRNGSPKAGSGSAETSRSLPDDIGFLEALDQQLG